MMGEMPQGNRGVDKLLQRVENALEDGGIVNETHRGKPQHHE